MLKLPVKWEYGVFAVFLIMETIEVMAFPLPVWWFWIPAFMLPGIYYGCTPLLEKLNFRSNISRTLVVCGLLCMASMPSLTLTQHPATLMLCLITGAMAMAYSGWGRYNLRQYGWLKPFIIGMVWSGFVSLLPTLHTGAHLTTALGFHFTKNALFISLIAILSDFRDAGTDKENQLTTWVVALGHKKAVFGVIWPVALLAALLFFWLPSYSSIHPMVNLLPFVMVMGVSLLVLKPRQNAFYRWAIDGHLLVKALLGILATLAIQ